jgi:hypothetical protein
MSDFDWRSRMRIVENTAERLVLRDGRLWSALIILTLAGAMMLTGIGYHASVRGLWPVLLPLTLLLVLFRFSQVTFDKVRRTCVVRRFDLRGLKRWDVAFGDIVKVAVEPAPTNRGISAMCCRMSLVTKAAAIPLTCAYEPGPERYRIMQQQILDVLSAGGGAAKLA